jgi:hypothetical protein
MKDERNASILDFGLEAPNAGCWLSVAGNWQLTTSN